MKSDRRGLLGRKFLRIPPDCPDGGVAYRDHGAQGKEDYAGKIMQLGAILRGDT